MKSCLLALCLACSPVTAKACDLALALAVDVSGSVDPGEYRIQMQGLAEGLRDSTVSEALVRGEAEVMLIQWSGSSRQEVSLPWRKLTRFEDVAALADEIEALPRAWRNFSTAIGEALLLLDHEMSKPRCKRLVIDVSGDGPSNEGIAPRAVHRQLKAKGVTVNALVIEGAGEDLTSYYWENVIMGEGAFVVTANGFKEYPARIRKKLKREVVLQLTELR